MSDAISMRELQKMSAARIRALPHPVPIKSGNELVGTLVPAKTRNELWKELEERSARLARQLTPEQRAELDHYLGEDDSE